MLKFALLFVKILSMNIGIYSAWICVCIVYIILKSGSILFNKNRLCISMNINFLFSIEERNMSSLGIEGIDLVTDFFPFSLFLVFFDAIQCNSIIKYMYFVHIWKPRNDIYRYWYCLQFSISFVRFSIENCILNNILPFTRKRSAFDWEFVFVLDNSSMTTSHQWCI